MLDGDCPALFAAALSSCAFPRLLTVRLCSIFDAIPLQYRQGPISPLAVAYCCTFVVWLLWTMPLDSLADITSTRVTSEHTVDPYFIFVIRLATAVYGASQVKVALDMLGPLGMKSYTMWSWCLLTLRAALGVLASERTTTTRAICVNVLRDTGGAPLSAPRSGAQKGGPTLPGSACLHS